MLPPEAIKTHAVECAATECLSTPDLLASALDCPVETARAALKFGCDIGLFRPVPLPSLGGRIAFQPTPKALKRAGSDMPSCPKFHRCGQPPDARMRGFLRGFVRFSGRPELSFLGAQAQESEVCAPNSIPTLGYSRALIGLDLAQHLHIFTPVLRAENPAAAVELAALRWLPLLNSGRATLHFVAAGAAAEALGATLKNFTTTPAESPAARELAALDAQILADKSGLLAIKFGVKRRELAAVVAAAGPAARPGYPWLASSVEVAS